MYHGYEGVCRCAAYGKTGNRCLVAVVGQRYAVNVMDEHVLRGTPQLSSVTYRASSPNSSRLTLGSKTRPLKYTLAPITMENTWYCLPGSFTFAMLDPRMDTRLTNAAPSID
ncbi:uncharacterized protein LOC100867612 isoform X2 [Apis florea]|uniref:uncharacterized protein LOC100867612 isoform X2 n=1 Tax=Apis florea TaxID=7463 RepID=UPI00062900C3|nr:uncharacterized protein LOC100867612 isoform X2 [Apis florea]